MTKAAYGRNRLGVYSLKGVHDHDGREHGSRQAGMSGPIVECLCVEATTTRQRKLIGDGIGF